MFFEFSHKKLAVVFAIFGVLLLASFAFISINMERQVLAQAVEHFNRQRSDALYWLSHALPFLMNREAAALGFASAPEAPWNAPYLPAGTAEAVPVLLYHGEESAAEQPTTEVFLEHMRALKSAGWRTVTLKEFRAFMKDGESLPEKSFLLTFDDGRKSTFYDFDPVLKDLGFTAVMFVITGVSLPDAGRSGSSFYLSPTELRYMIESGRWELASHGDQDHRLYEVPRLPVPEGQRPEFIPGEHFLSNLFWLQGDDRLESEEEFSMRIARDLEDSKRKLEERFGTPVFAFAFPFNDYGQNTANFSGARSRIAEATRSIYEFSFYQVYPKKGDLFNHPDPETSLIKRLEPPISWSAEELLDTLRVAAPKHLPYSQTVFGEEWAPNWGMIEMQSNGYLSLRARENASGATTFLSGTSAWEGYRFTATLASKNDASVVSLIAHYDERRQTYATCAFSDTRIYAEEVAGAEKTILKSAPYTAVGPPRGRSFSIEVQGPRMACITDGERVEAERETSPYRGSIGLQVWARELGVADMTIQRMQVEPL